MSVKERFKEIRVLPNEELRAQIEKNREKVFRMRFHGKGKDIENPGQMKLLRRDIARMSTVLSERARERALAQAGGKK